MDIFPVYSVLTIPLCHSDDGRGSQDALQLTLPIEGLQDPVSLATSFVVQATDNGAAKWVEGLQLPDALPGSGSIQIQAGVGRLPAVLANARQIMETDVKYVLISFVNRGTADFVRAIHVLFSPGAARIGMYRHDGVPHDYNFVCIMH